MNSYASGKVFAVVACLAASTRTSSGQDCPSSAGIEGCWGPLVPIVVDDPLAEPPLMLSQTDPVQAVHSILINNGNVLIVDFLEQMTSANVVVIDLSGASPSIRNAGEPLTPGGPFLWHNLFCAGHTQLDDGRIFFRGGPENGVDNKRVTIYVPEPPGGTGVGTWQVGDLETWAYPPGGQDVSSGRYYPTCTSLASGRVLVLDGWNGCTPIPSLGFGFPNVPAVFDPSATVSSEVWEPLYGGEYYPNDSSASCFFSQCTAGPNPFGLGWYPLAFLDGNGGVFVAGKSDKKDCAEDERGLLETRTLNLGAQTWAAPFPPLPSGPLDPIPDGALGDGTAVMFAANTILKVGRKDSTEPVLQRASIIHLDDLQPEWMPVADMPTGRDTMTLIALPSGRILAINGTFFDVNGVLAGPDLYDPYTNTWTHLADVPDPPGPVTAQPRGYHSSAILLPDGSIFTGGGEYCGDDDPKGCACDLVVNQYCLDQWSYQIFRPPYFFDENGDLAVRPAIDSCASASTIFYGGRFAVTLATPDAQNVTKVRLIRPGAMTHSFDQSQRSMELNFCAVPGSDTKLTVDAPDTGNDAPPGYYMLFVATGENGALPSVAHWVRVIEGGAAGASVVDANPPVESPWQAGEVYRDPLDTGDGPDLTHGIGGDGTPAEGGITYAPITVTFDGPVMLAAADIDVTCTYTGTPACDTPCPKVATVVGSGAGPYTLTLTGPIPPGSCTEIRFSATAAVQFQSLPGDVNLDGAPNTQDLAKLIQAMNSGEANANPARFDLNRSAEASFPVNSQDLLRLIQLLNGTNTTQVWNGVPVVPCLECAGESFVGGGSSPAMAGGAGGGMPSDGESEEACSIDFAAVIWAACAESGWSVEECQPLVEFVSGQP